MKVALASSGLGHIARGMESWAETLAEHLCVRGIDVTLFRGAGPAIHTYDKVLPTFSRSSKTAKIIALLTSVGGWRIGLGSAHGVESFIYSIQLMLHLGNGYDLVHVQQGSTAIFLSRMQRLGFLKIPVIFANGQKASSEFLNRFSIIQYLSPFDNENNFLGIDPGCDKYIIPNFVDTDFFSPGDKKLARRKIGLKEDCFMILSVGLIDRSVKRMDYFLNEVQAFRKQTGKKITCVIAGSYGDETQKVLASGKSMLGDNLVVLRDVDLRLMPDLYRAADVFALCSYREAFGLAIAEAMACGLPVICHNFPTIKWIVGEAGECNDLSKKGALADLIGYYYSHPEYRSSLGQVARDRIQKQFSTDVIIDRIINMYQAVVSRSNRLT